jgi:hypothetical protein
MRRTLRLAVVLMIGAGVAFGGAALAGRQVSITSNGFTFSKIHGDSDDRDGVKPGKGCGDKNHTHYREDECKDKDKGKDKDYKGKHGKHDDGDRRDGGGNDGDD